MVIYDHPQVALIAPTGEFVSVDEHMVDLIQALWSMNVVTHWSCQGYSRRRASLPNYAYVQADGNEAAEVAIRRLLSHGTFSESVYEHGDYESAFNGDYFKFRRHNLVIERESDFCGAPGVSIRFPAHHRDLALELLSH